MRAYIIARQLRASSEHGGLVKRSGHFGMHRDNAGHLLGHVYVLSTIVALLWSFTRQV